MSQLSYLLLIERLRRLIQPSDSDLKQQQLMCDQEQVSVWLSDFHSALTLVLKHIPELEHVATIDAKLAKPSTLVFTSISQSPLQVWNEYIRINVGKTQQEVWQNDWQRFLYREFQQISLGYSKSFFRKQQEQQVTTNDLLRLVSTLRPEYGLQMIEQSWTDDLRIVLGELYKTLLQTDDNGFTFDREQTLRKQQCFYLMQKYNAILNEDQRQLLLHQYILTAQNVEEALLLVTNESKEWTSELSLWKDYFTYIRADRAKLRPEDVQVYSPELEHLLWRIVNATDKNTKDTETLVNQVPSFVVQSYRWKWIEQWWKMKSKTLPFPIDRPTQVATVQSDLVSMVNYLKTLREFFSLSVPG